MHESVIQSRVFLNSLLISIIIGILCRGFILVVRNNQYPRRPQDYIEQIISAGLSASLGAIALPALLDKEYAALTFFAIAIQQFQGLSEQERITIKNTDIEDIVPKGDDYVEEVSATYEARSYVSLISALASSIAFISVARSYSTNLIICTLSSVVAGVIVGAIFSRCLSRKNVDDFADVIPANIHFDGPLLKVNGTLITNIGLSDIRKRFMDNALAVEIIPKNKKLFGILSDSGQMQAILHNIYIHLGVDKDIDEMDVVTIAKVNTKNNTILIPFIPILKDIDVMIDAVKSAPILESSKRKQGIFIDKFKMVNKKT